MEELQSVYREAVRGAVFETGIEPPELPEICPFTLDQVIASFDLDWPG